MSTAADLEFDRLIQDALTEASGIECSPEDFRAALRDWQGEIQAHIRASEATSGISNDEDES